MQSKTKIAYSYIKNQIIEGALSPLTDISEDELIVKLSISRTPVREAIKQLEAERFVIIYPRKNTLVAPITVETMEQVYETRMLIEPVLVRQACQVLDDAVLQDMKIRLENAPPALSEYEYKRHYIALDQELHRMIVECTSNPFLKKAMRNAYDHNQRFRIKAAEYPTELLTAIEEHTQIINALIDRNTELAVEHTLRHLESSMVNIHRFGFTL